MNYSGKKTKPIQRIIITAILLVGITACQSQQIPPTPTPEPLSFYYKQTQPLLAERRYTEAIEIFEQAAQIHANHPGPLIRIGQIYLIQQRWLLAEDAFNRALARDLQNATAANGLAQTLLHQGRLTEALKWSQKATAFDPETPGVFTTLGKIHLFQFEFEAAQAAFTQQQTHTFDPEAVWYLAALTAPHNLTDAREHLLQISNDNSSSVLLEQRDYLWTTLAPFTNETPPVEIAKATGIAMAHIKHWPLAYYALSLAAEQADELPPEAYAETLAFLGYTSAQSGRPALELFEQAQQIDPASGLPLYFEGIYLRRQNALTAAEYAFQKAVALDLRNAAIYAEIADTKLAQGDSATARLWYHAAVEIAEDKLPFQLLLLNFYANRGYLIKEDGIPLAKEILKEDQENAAVHDMLGWMQFLTGDIGDAEATLRKAVELDPNLISARYHLARLLETTEQIHAAREEYQRVVDWDTASGYRDPALKALLRLNASTD